MEERFLVHLDPGSFEFPSNCDCHLVFMPFCLKMEKKKKKMGNCIFFLMLCAPGLGSLLLVVVHACTLPGMCRMDL